MTDRDSFIRAGVADKKLNELSINIPHLENFSPTVREYSRNAASSSLTPQSIAFDRIFKFKICCFKKLVANLRVRQVRTTKWAINAVILVFLVSLHNLLFLRVLRSTFNLSANDTLFIVFRTDTCNCLQYWWSLKYPAKFACRWCIKGDRRFPLQKKMVSTKTCCKIQFYATTRTQTNTICHV